MGRQEGMGRPGGMAPQGGLVRQGSTAEWKRGSNLGKREKTENTKRMTKGLRGRRTVENRENLMIGLIETKFDLVLPVAHWALGGCCHQFAISLWMKETGTGETNSYMDSAHWPGCMLKAANADVGYLLFQICFPSSFGATWNGMAQ